MKQILFVQGGGADVHEAWDLALVQSLRRELGSGYDVRYPTMPNESDPSVAHWRPTLERELASLGAGAIVVGHSVGATILIEVLASAATKTSLDAIVLIAAPFVGEGGWPSEEIAPRPDLAERLSAEARVFLYHGEDDDVVPVAHVDLYARAIPRALVRRLAGRDHQLNDDLSEVARDIRDLQGFALRRRARG